MYPFMFYLEPKYTYCIINSRNKLTPELICFVNYYAIYSSNSCGYEKRNMIYGKSADVGIIVYNDECTGQGCDSPMASIAATVL